MVSEKKKFTTVLIVIILFFASPFRTVHAEIVAFHNPSPWITLRSDKIVAKTLIDTVEVKNRPIKITLSKIINNKSIKIVTKNFKANDYSHEYELANIGSNIIGGTDFLKIDWEIVGTEKKGTVSPFGIVSMSNVSLENVFECKKFSSKLDFDKINKESNFTSVGNTQFYSAWNNNNLVLVLKNVKDADYITFTFDGKNGKNAFLSYPDRICTYFPKTDSIDAVFYKRNINEKSIEYNENKWINDITKHTNDGHIFITIPWYDLGMSSSAGRILGFSAFANYKNKNTIALPSSAKKEIPGTWGNMKLVK